MRDDWHYSPQSTFVVQRIGLARWVMDCCADECVGLGGSDVSPHAEYDSKRAAEAAATSHRRWHRGLDASQVPCPTCGGRVPAPPIEEKP